MLLGIRRGVAVTARIMRKALSMRVWQRWVVASMVVVLGTSGAVAAVSALPAQAAHPQAGQSLPPASPHLDGFRQGLVQISDSKIHYVIGGHGPVLILLHGWPESWWTWHRVMPGLAKSHTVIAFDLPGLGDSTVPTSGGYTATDAAKRIHQAVRALGYNKVSILSHDLGANISYAYADLYQHSVGKVAVLDTLLNGFGLEGIYGFSFHFLLNMQPAPTPENIINNREAEQTYLNYVYKFAVKAHNVNADAPVYYAAYANPANREAGYNYYRSFPANEAYNTAHATTKLTIPMLAIGGEDSFGTGVGSSFSNVDSDVLSVVAPGAGHFVQEEDPGFTTECTRLFFASGHPTPPAGYAGCVSSS
jgi:pimeloyl-ACP methyl ester carboxylesterase